MNSSNDSRYQNGFLNIISIFLAFIVVFCFSTLASAQPDTTRWSPELSMQYDNITETAISPDGEQVAYVVREAVMDKTTSEFRNHIYIAASDGSSDLQYTRGEHSNWSPQWSPDGKRIAFLSTRKEKPQIFVIRLRGGEPYAVTNSKTGIQNFQWGPEGKRIAYLMTNPKTKTEKKREKQKRDVMVVGEEHRHTHLYTTEVKPANDTTRREQRLTKGDFNVNSFDWSPDGNTIVFAHKPTPRVNDLMDTDISIVPADSGKVTLLVDRPGADYDPRFSPNGQTIAFGSNGGEKAWWYKNDIWTISVDGGTPKALPHTPNRDVNVIGWSQDGKSLLVWDTHHTSTQIYEIPVEGEQVSTVTQAKGVFGAVSYSPSADRLSFSYQNSNTAPEVYVSPRSDFRKQQISKRNTEKPSPTMGNTELVRWTAPDGTTIEGLLTYPVNYNGSDQVPLILDIHGGPGGVHSRSFMRNILIAQYFAEHGYATLRPNPRGSDGKGLDFRSAIQGNWGHGDINDQLSGVDHLIQKDIVHPDSLAIWGGSYGGYMTAFMITQTDRFKAAMMYAGVADNISMVGTTDIPDWQIAQMGGPYWENFKAYREHSPIFHVENVTTPTLIIHGAEDQRVPTSQGREFYRALTQEGVPTKMLIYPRMPHSLGEPKQYIHWISRTLDWFDEHLGRSDS